MSNQNDALRRLVPKRSWGDRHGVGVILWTALGAVALLLAFGCTILLFDLLVTRGQLPAPLPMRFDQLAGESYTGPRTGDLGLVATAARYGEAIGWRWLPRMVMKFPGLASTTTALTALAGVLLLSLLTVVWAFSQARHIAAVAARQQATSLRSAIHRQTLRLGPSDTTDSRYQSAFQLFTTDTEVIRNALTAWRAGLVRGYILLPLLVGFVLCLDWRLGLQCLIPAGFCWWVYRHERTRRSRERELADSHVETEVQFLAAGLRKTRLVRGYNIEEFEQQSFQQHLDRLNRESQTGRQQERWLIATGGMLLLLGSLLIVVMVGLRVVTPTHPVPLAVGFTMIVTIIALALEVPRLERVVSQQSVMQLVADRIYRYLDEIPEVGQAVGAKFIQPLTKLITFEAVGYRRGNKQVLQSLDLKIASGSQTALVALDEQLPKIVAYLLPRFMEPTSGRVLYDGQDIAWGTLESIRAETIFVGGDDPVLNGTVSQNLHCGDADFDLHRVTEAAKLVHAHNFITKLPQGYETVLGEHGEQLSPGQVFRISLARAILRNPTVLIIEEPSVLLDEDTKTMIDDAYQRIAPGRTLLYLPSRLSTVKRCDQVILLAEGKVDAVGTHSELRKNSELYRHWNYTRFNTYRHKGHGSANDDDATL